MQEQSIAVVGSGGDLGEWLEREWVGVMSRSASGVDIRRYASFYETSVRLPALPGFEEATRCEWATDGNGGLRLRVGDTGELRLTFRSHRSRLVQTASLQRALGRGIRGQYPIVAVDGRDMFIDISDQEAS